MTTYAKPRRRIAANLDGHHWPQQRALLLLPLRRAFRAEMRRPLASSFAPSPRYVCLQCGLTARSPNMLCEPEPISDRFEQSSCGTCPSRHDAVGDSGSDQGKQGARPMTVVRAVGTAPPNPQASWSPQQWLDAGRELAQQADEAERIARDRLGSD